MSEATIPLAGEPLALDLINTLANGPDGEPVDLLAGPETTAAWLSRQQELGRLTGAQADGLDLRALRLLRSHIAESVEQARLGAPPTALSALNHVLRAAPAYPQLSWDGAAVTATVNRSGQPQPDLHAELAQAAADLLCSPAVRQIRACEGANCRLLFVLTHPKRRWCSATTCGNRARVARHYQKHRG